jgi:hypothetical protein
MRRYKQIKYWHQESGLETIKINAEGLVKSISEKMSEIESECNALLEIAPNIALDNKICRKIFISNY